MYFPFCLKSLRSQRNNPHTFWTTNQQNLVKHRQKICTEFCHSFFQKSSSPWQIFCQSKSSWSLCGLPSSPFPLYSNTTQVESLYIFCIGHGKMHSPTTERAGHTLEYYLELKCFSPVENHNKFC